MSSLPDTTHRLARWWLFLILHVSKWQRR